MSESPVQQLKGAGPLRLGLGGIGIIAIGYATVRILQDHAHTNPVHLAIWLAAAVIIHDGIIAPLTVGIGWMTRYVPYRARPFVQGGLGVAALVTIVSIPLIHRQGQSGPGSALLKQNYTRNLFILLAVIAVATIALYSIRVVRQRPVRVHDEPPAEQEAGSA